MSIIAHIFFVASFFSLLAGIGFEGTMTEMTLHWGPELDLVLGAIDETFVVRKIVHCLLEFVHTANQKVSADAFIFQEILFIEGGQVTQHFVADWTLVLFFHQQALVTECCTSLTMVDNCFDVGLDGEGLPCAFVLFPELNRIPLPRLRPHAELPDISSYHHNMAYVGLIHFHFECDPSTSSIREVGSPFVV